MAENNFSNIIKGFMIITLFISLLLTAVISFSSNYDHVDQDDITQINDMIGLDSVNNTLNTANETATGWKATFGGLKTDTSKLGQLFDIVGFIAVGFFSLLISMFNFINIPFTVIQNIAINVLNIPSSIMVIAWVLLMISVMLGIWRLIKQGR